MMKYIHNIPKDPAVNQTAQKNVNSYSGYQALLKSVLSSIEIYVCCYCG